MKLFYLISSLILFITLGHTQEVSEVHFNYNERFDGRSRTTYENQDNIETSDCWVLVFDANRLWLDPSFYGYLESATLRTNLRPTEEIEVNCEGNSWLALRTETLYSCTGYDSHGREVTFIPYYKRTESLTIYPHLTFSERYLNDGRVQSQSCLLNFE